MRIWVDADACPVSIREILFRAARRTGIRLTLVANQPLRIPPSSLVDFMQVAAGFDMADKAIVQHMQSGDLVITGDIPLAADVIAAGGLALSPRGERYTADNIANRLQMRNMMDNLRAGGITTGGPAAFTAANRKAFADQLDRLLTQLSK